MRNPSQLSQKRYWLTVSSLTRPTGQSGKQITLLAFASLNGVERKSAEEVNSCKTRVSSYPGTDRMKDLLKYIHRQS